MARKRFKQGDRLRRIKRSCSTSYHGDVEIGDILVHAGSDDNNDFFKAEGFGEAGFDEAYFELVKERTAFDVEQLEGWLTLETYHASLCIFNDAKILKSLDYNIVTKGSLKSVVFMTSGYSLPLGMEKDRVDTWSIQRQRAMDLHENGVIDGSQLSHWLEKLTGKESISATCKRRLKLLKEEGFETDDHFFDHYAAMKHALLAEASDNVLTINREEQNMRQNTFETKTFINGTDIKNFDASAQGQFIVDNDTEIARLEGFSVKTKAIKKQITQLKADNKKAVELFDSLED